ncbi:MAG: hypothetical protein R3B47_12200 [Bacteroidia bacterium]
MLFTSLPWSLFSGDSGYVDEDGCDYYAGWMISSMCGPPPVNVRMKRIAKHPDVAECAVIGIEDALMSQPVGFVVPKEGAKTPESGD